MGGLSTDARSEAFHEQVRAALGRVRDPHFDVSIEDMGMLLGVYEDAGQLTVRLALPCLGCPAWEDIRLSIEEELGSLEGVKAVEVVTDWEAPWSLESLGEAARGVMSSYGVRL